MILPARLRAGSQWADACILNISSRGLMIQTGQAAAAGTIIELRRDRHLIVARVMWRDGGRIGLHSQERLPVEEILSLGQADSLRLIASDGVIIERRERPRRDRQNARLRGRGIEFAGVVAIALGLALSVVMLARETLSRPFAAVENILGP